MSNAIWNIWEPIKGGIDRGVAFVSGVLDSVAWIPFVPLINFEINETWTLIANEGDALTGFAHDLINAGNQFVVDTVHGEGLIAATVNAWNSTVESIGTRGGQAVQALIEWGRAQIEFLIGVVTPGVVNPSIEQQETAPLVAVGATEEVIGSDDPTTPATTAVEHDLNDRNGRTPIDTAAELSRQDSDLPDLEERERDVEEVVEPDDDEEAITGLPRTTPDTTTPDDPPAGSVGPAGDAEGDDEAAEKSDPEPASDSESASKDSA